MVNFNGLQTLKEDRASLFDLKHAIYTRRLSPIRTNPQGITMLENLDKSVDEFLEQVDKIFTLVPEHTLERSEGLESSISQVANQANKALVVARNLLNKVDNKKYPIVWDRMTDTYLDIRNYYYKKIKPLTLDLTAFDFPYLSFFADSKAKRAYYFTTNEKFYANEHKKVLAATLENFLLLNSPNPAIDQSFLSARIKISRELEQIEQILIETARNLLPPKNIAATTELPINFQDFVAEFNQAFNTQYSARQIYKILYNKQERRTSTKDPKAYADLINAYVKNISIQCSIATSTNDGSKLKSKISDKLKPLLLLHLMRLAIMEHGDLEQTLSIHTQRRINELRFAAIDDIYSSCIHAIHNPSHKDSFTEGLGELALKRNYLAIPKNLLLLWNLNPNPGEEDDDLIEGFNQSLAAVNKDFEDEHNISAETLQNYGQTIIQSIHKYTQLRKLEPLTARAPEFMKLVTAFVYQNLNKISA